LFVEIVSTDAWRIYASMVSDIPTSNGSRSKTIRMLGYMDVMGVVVRNKKLDWAQRAVDCVTGAESDDPFSTGYMLQASTATNLLRAHHRKVKRMVNKLLREAYERTGRFEQAQGFAIAVATILAKLKEVER